MPCGTELIAEINQAAPPEGGCTFWWLGQHSFVLKLAGKVIYIDPYLTASEDRLLPPPLQPGEVTNADLILGTHDHLDHIDREALPGMAAASLNAKIVVPELHREGLAALLFGIQERNVERRVMYDQFATFNEVQKIGGHISKFWLV